LTATHNARFHMPPDESSMFFPAYRTPVQSN
jgi:hypothetical protein